jgi:hypothetical protein
MMFWVIALSKRLVVSSWSCNKWENDTALWTDLSPKFTRLKPSKSNNCAFRTVVLPRVIFYPRNKNSGRRIADKNNTCKAVTLNKRSQWKNPYSKTSLISFTSALKNVFGPPVGFSRPK